MPVPSNPVIRPVLLFGALGTLLLSAGQAMAANDPAAAGFGPPDFFVELNTTNGVSSNPGDPDHPSGQLGFKFLEGGTCTGGNICLDLSVWNTSNADPAAPGNPGGGILSSQMVSAAFNVPGITGLTVPDFGTTPGSYLSNTSSLYPLCASTTGCVADVLINAFTTPPDNEISNIAFDVCATSQTGCQSGGQPNGLQNGEFTIVRFLFPYEGVLTASEIADEFIKLYSVPEGEKLAKATDYNVIGRWQAVECAGSPCAGSDKIGGGIPGVEPPGPKESVPGPLPLMGAAAAFGFSRKLRHRIAAVGTSRSYIL